MLKRTLLALVAVGSGFLLATYSPAAIESARTILPGTRHEPAVSRAMAQEAAKEEPNRPGFIALKGEQIAKSKIQTETVAGGLLTRHLHVPGTIIPSADNTARIAVKTQGIVAELRKGLGDKVAKGEVVALLDSREIADAKGEYLAVRVAADLQRTLYEREKALWDKRISSEQAFLRAQAAYQDIKVKEDAARRKLTFLGFRPAELDALMKQPEAQFERQEIRSPIAGKIVERRVDLGAAVGRDSLETELYSVVDLSTVWVDLAVTPGDQPLVHEGQTVTVQSDAIRKSADGRIIFIGPVMDATTRVARVVAQLPNPGEVWRPGSFVNAAIKIAERRVPMLIASDALQTVEGKPHVFVKVEGGFEAHPVVLGGSDDGAVEVVSGLEPGQVIATKNSFILKADLGKAAAED